MVTTGPNGWPATSRHGERNEPAMANPFVKAWKYLMALFSSKVDEYADPKVQIQQAIEDAQRQHAAGPRADGAVRSTEYPSDRPVAFGPTRPRRLGDGLRFVPPG